MAPDQKLIEESMLGELARWNPPKTKAALAIADVDPSDHDASDHDGEKLAEVEPLELASGEAGDGAEVRLDQETG
eukprot:5549280-Pyramimonas_sp.AAC.1